MSQNKRVLRIQATQHFIATNQEYLEIVFGVEGKKVDGEERLNAKQSYQKTPDLDGCFGKNIYTTTSTS